MIELLNKLYGNAIVFSNLRAQHRIPYFSEKKLHELRDRRLRRIVQYAAKTVPYYRDFFQREGINSGQIKTVADLDRLPLVDKQELRKDPSRFLSNSALGKNSIAFLTSGSTGLPLNIHHDSNSLLANIAFGERQREVITGICGRKVGYREALISYNGCVSTKVWDFYEKKTYIPVRPQRLLIPISKTIEAVVQELNRFRPNVLIGYGSYLEAFFKTIYSMEVNIQLPQVLLYGGDAMTNAGRDFIEEKFGVPVLSTYQAMECFKIGFFCENRENFHLHEDLCHVKIVNADGEEVADDEKGEVVISNLVNRGTVLLNYRLGDIASISNRKCSCGRTLSLLSEIEGRVEDIIILPDGQFVHPRVVWSIFKHKNEVLQYQLIQHELMLFELKLVTGGQETVNGFLNELLTDLREVLGESSTIEAEFYNELPRQNRGKFRSVMSYCKSNVI
ncbi:MAG: phenylacetate--CoA ligase family protein [Caldithrix sp.]|nr:MAG: phenylacetate--CoA ligase family protein [Caldithrix sp.]